MIKLYLSEDQQMMNNALAMLLALEDNFTVIGSATDGTTALADIIKLKPDVAILDIEMPGKTGLEVADALQQKAPKTKVIILTTFARAKYFKQALAANVSGYLLKDSPSETLVSAINTILQGNTVFDPKLVASVLHTVKNPLTKREQEILAALKIAPTTKELAQHFYLSEGTIRNYISAILSKTATHSRMEAYQLALKKHWI